MGGDPTSAPKAVVSGCASATAPGCGLRHWGSELGARCGSAAGSRELARGIWTVG